MHPRSLQAHAACGSLVGRYRPIPPHGSSDADDATEEGGQFLGAMRAQNEIKRGESPPEPAEIRGGVLGQVQWRECDDRLSLTF